MFPHHLKLSELSGQDVLASIVQAYPADKAISKGNAEAGLLAHILVQKYCNHLPYYRQCEIYEREGVMISRSTMAGWAGSCSRLLIDLVVSELKKSVFNSKHIHGDDTVIKVLATWSWQNQDWKNLDLC